MLYPVKLSSKPASTTMARKLDFGFANSLGTVSYSATTPAFITRTYGQRGSQLQYPPNKHTELAPAITIIIQPQQHVHPTIIERQVTAYQLGIIIIV